MSQARELIQRLKKLDAVGIKRNWSKQQLEDAKERAIIDYQHQEHSIHHKDHHHVRRDLDTL
jgi:hypothetical protein|tara:strand:+ start:390 stop:575 length:186 start_codon:yes stop_codon:yes gene_type:complete